MTVLVFLDPDYPAGRIADSAKPTLMATDQGVTRGDGVFESMLAIHSKPRKVQAHLDRLGRSARALEIDLPSQEAWLAAITTAITAFEATEPASDDGIVVKLIVTRGVEGGSEPTAWVQAAAPSPIGRIQREQGLDVLLLDRGFDSSIAERAPWLLLGAKTLSYAVNMAALRHAHNHGADDVIFTSGDGRVLEGPTSSVLMAQVEGEGAATVKRLITPQLDIGILPGTTQGALFAAARSAGWELGYGPVKPADLLAADAVWLISSIRLLAPVNHIDGTEIGNPDVRARLTAELDALLAGTE